MALGGSFIFFKFKGTYSINVATEYPDQMAHDLGLHSLHMPHERTPGKMLHEHKTNNQATTKLVFHSNETSKDKL